MERVWAGGLPQLGLTQPEATPHGPQPFLGAVARSLMRPLWPVPERPRTRTRGLQDADRPGPWAGMGWVGRRSWGCAA